MGFSQYSDERRSFVMNFNPKEVDGGRLLRIASQLNIPAWVGEPVFGKDGCLTGLTGFYVYHTYRNLTRFWDVVNAKS